LGVISRNLPLYAAHVLEVYMAEVEDTFGGGRLPNHFDEREVEVVDDHSAVEPKSEQNRSGKVSSLRRSIEDRLEKKRLDSLIEDYSFDDIGE
jgi:hypothetical protein